MSKIEELKDLLRSQFRIKYGVDYAITNKYGQIRVMCHGMWRDKIEESAKRIGIEIDEWFTYQ